MIKNPNQSLKITNLVLLNAINVNTCTQDLIKCSEDCPGYPTLLDALDQMLAVLRSVDESMLQGNIVDCPVSKSSLP